MTSRHALSPPSHHASLQFAATLARVGQWHRLMAYSAWLRGARCCSPKLPHRLGEFAKSFLHFWANQWRG
eukprot:scaffold6871_cov29-Tisochrysis_lutea.AAC.2